MIDPGLRGKIALITGGNHGIGAATAKMFASKGTQVAIAYFDGVPNMMADGPGTRTELFNPGKLWADSVVMEIDNTEGQAISIPGDLSDVTTVPVLFDGVESAFGSVDILINNAAHCKTLDDIRTTSVGSIDRHFAVNVRAAVMLISEYVKRYHPRKGKSGRIVNISTDCAQHFVKQILYGASKLGLEAYTRSIAPEAAT